MVLWGKHRKLWAIWGDVGDYYWGEARRELASFFHTLFWLASQLISFQSEGNNTLLELKLTLAWELSVNQTPFLVPVRRSQNAKRHI